MNSDMTAQAGSTRLLKLLIFLMFASFAMTTDSVGTIIPEIIRDYQLGMTAAGAFHYASMSGIGLAAILLGFLADRFGRKATILLGLGLFCATCALFAIGNSFAIFVLLLFVSGLGIGIFKAGALALIGEISHSTREHAANMNLVEGFFGVGAVIGPAIVTYSLHSGASWKIVYLIAAALCFLLVIGTLFAPFPKTQAASGAEERTDTREAFRMLGDPFALFFAAALMLYVGAEAAIYVWAPTYFADYDGSYTWLAAYLVSVFFVLRAVGRFFGAWLLSKLDWTKVIAICSTAMAILFWIGVAGGRNVAVFALPATGIFMSVLYPTMNSTGISCFEKARHGSIAGFLLFFTCVGAVIAPLAMGAVGDWLDNSDYSMVLGSVFASVLAVLCLWNLIAQPIARKLAERNSADYGDVPLAEGAAQGVS
ncbi:MFS transporter [Altericroceibacterium endophyticum]|uniref:MFS transporter n=1 Tax=Altericroceibacterium endophyticum TaxID=1808508 RepID=A0A6I4T9G6_9SPHN|nr:MFS transporter [Altericroceibacterium endophyticum]MXO66415.1 MFS transporter [Altericroceibacterium endophyticum]